MKIIKKYKQVVWFTGNKPFWGLNIFPNILTIGQTEEELMSKILKGTTYTFYAGSQEEYMEVLEVLVKNGLCKKSQTVVKQKEVLPVNRIVMNQSDLADSEMKIRTGIGVKITDKEVQAREICDSIKELRNLGYKFSVEYKEDWRTSVYI